jgi:signal transduction histidine kinase
MIPAARHTIIENMSDAVLVLDQRHRVVDLNPAARRIVGRSTTNSIGKPTGTALGLPICKQIVQHHGDRIWVESDLGKGSKFAFTLLLNSTEPQGLKASKPLRPEEVRGRRGIEQ